MGKFLQSYCSNGVVFCFFFGTILTTHASLSQFSVRLPDTTAEVGMKLKIPLRVSELKPFAVTSFSFVVSCDTNVATLDGVEQEGTLAQEALLAANNHVGPFHAGRMKVASASGVPYSGKGILAYLVVSLKKTVGVTALILSQFNANGDSTKARVTNGSLKSVARKVQKPEPKK